MAKIGQKSKKNKFLKLYFYILYSIILILFLGFLFFIGIFDIFENKIIDFRFKYFNQNKKISKDIIFIDIDDGSLATLSPQLGGWPWKRGGVIAKRMIDYIAKGKPKIIIFDILYTEYSPKDPGEDIPDEDMILLEYSIDPEFVNVSHAALFLTDIKQEKEIPENNFAINIDDSNSKIKFPSYSGVLLPFSPLDSYATSIHFVNHNEDNDGISRKLPLIIKFNEKYYPSLSLVGLKYYFNINSFSLSQKILTLKTDNDKIKVPLNEKGEFLINFYGNFEKDVNTFTAESIIVSNDQYRSGKQPLVNFEEFKDKIVIIGSSATGLKDLKITPLGKTVAGPYLHLTLISNIIQKDFLYTIPKWFNFLILIFTILFVLFSTMFLKGKYLKNIIGFAYLFIIIIIGLFSFKFFSLVFDMFLVILASILSYIGGLIFLSLTEESEKRKIYNTMSKYLAPTVMKEVLENYDELIGEVGKKREITVLFSDIRGFTTVSEKYPPEVVVSVLNRYLEAMIEVIFENDGTLDKIIGDAIMAFWGAPTPQQNRDILAINTGLGMIRRLKELNKKLIEDGLPELKNGIGINTGDMIVGNIGSSKRLDYTLIGDNVNLGSRLEGLTKYYKVPILTSGATYNYAKDKFIWLFADKVAVKGKSEAVLMYAPLCEIDHLDRENVIKEIKLFEDAQQFYFDKKFEIAKNKFEKLLDFKIIGGISSLYIERCDYFIANPPEKNWDGSWKMTEK
ncbi:MAG TPA: adenylate/guanylate cyclase domain-containing protein [Spirochaetota bacterium]|nr:adenylate/guanylate cyclase domain-containing protein [Spirochaetota bacterium]